jgi:hypothetical protein
VTDQAGGAHRFASHDPPEILSADGEPSNLPAELMPGSVVNLEVAEDTLLTIQIVKHVARNPFAARTRPVQTVNDLPSIVLQPSPDGRSSSPPGPVWKGLRDGW